MQIGDKVNWLYTPPGGYGYTHYIAAIVSSISGKRVKIEVKEKVGGEWVSVFKMVKPENLLPRNLPCEAFGELN